MILTSESEKDTETYQIPVEFQGVVNPLKNYDNLFIGTNICGLINHHCEQEITVRCRHICIAITCNIYIIWLVYILLSFTSTQLISIRLVLSS